MASPKRSDRRGGSPCGKRAPDWEALRLFFAAASYEQLVPCRCIGPRRSSLRLRAFPAAALCKQLALCALPAAAPCKQLAVALSPLRPYASSFLPAVSMLSSSASAPSRVSSFANT